MARRCNLTPEEREQIFNSPLFGQPSMEDEERAKALFSPVLFIDTYGERGYRWIKCSACGQAGEHFKREEPEFFTKHHGDVTTCPYCGRKVFVQFYSKLGKGTQLHQTKALSFVQTDGNALYITSGVGMWDYSTANCEWSDSAYPHGDMELEFWDKKRYYIAPGKLQEWSRSIYFGMMQYLCGRAEPWKVNATVTEPFPKNPMYGFDGTGQYIGLERVYQSGLKYCGIEKFFEDVYKYIPDEESIFDEENMLKLVIPYLSHAAMRPQVEMAVKLGLSDFVNNLIQNQANTVDLNWNAKTPAAFLKLSKADAKAFIEEPDPTLLHYIHVIQRSGSGMSVREITEAAGKVGRKNIDKVAKLCEKHGLNLRNTCRYLATPERTELWTDYIDMATELGYDISTKELVTPKNLEERHDMAAANYKIRRKEVQEKKYLPRYKMLCRKYGFRLGEWEIVVPTTMDEIITEGKVLHHCVGGYASRHIEGKTTILFLRKARTPWRSFLTIELVEDKGEIRQIHGYKDERYPHAVDPKIKYADFLNTWKEWFRAGSKRLPDGTPIIKEKRRAA